MDTSISVLVMGDPIPAARARRGSFVDLIRQAAPAFGTHRWRAHDVRVGAEVPRLGAESAVIITGSALSVTEELPWKEAVSAQLRELVKSDVPVLGICFGHQLLAHALGGRVSKNPNGREMGSNLLEVLVDDELLGARRSFVVNNTHVDSVVELPPGARVIARTSLEAHAAVRFAPGAWGVQFHPEIDADVLRDYFAARRPILLAEGFDIDAGERGLRDAPESLRLIERFLELARARWAARAAAEAERRVAERGGGGAPPPTGSAELG
ncbi:MAG TPA: glutamine amidotransferase [Polyangiaceae bacterium]|nr:glutamine amidotransferase [Polyangiaceae bacterium]